MMRAALLTLLIISQTAVLVAMVKRGLVRSFPFFFLYVACLLARQTRLCFLDVTDPEYLRFWALTLVVVIPLQILAAGESAYRSLEQFRELRAGVFVGAVAVAVLVATFIYDLQTRQTHLGRFSLADQAVSTTLFLAGTALAFGLTWINPRRPRNAMLHERLLLFHLGLLAASLFLLHQGHAWLNAVALPLSTAGFFAWAWLVQNDADLAPTRPAVQSAQDDFRGSGAGPSVGERGSTGWAGIR